ncbi:MAG TPA: hypothetical protein PLU11_11460 [Chitinophagaceae bacterium]|nr:hypothetical protein [Chitinophagaceae bacterium]HPN59787.1 hypothetical protein [Chitinophagaceae bacterium]
MRLSIFMLFALALLSGGLLRAQPFTLDNITPTELLLVDYKKEDTLRRGLINVTTVNQVKDTAWYFVKGLSMFSPVYFGLTAPEGNGNIRVQLCKDNWKTANRSGETGEKRHYQEQFKTEGDFGIMVIAEQKPASYTMITWTGKEAKEVGITSPFKGEGEGAIKEQGGNFLKENYLYILIGLMVVVIAYLVFKMKKSKN